MFSAVFQSTEETLTDVHTHFGFGGGDRLQPFLCCQAGAIWLQ